MSKNPYWNTIWSHRDQEFYWSGIKDGILIGAIVVPCMCMTVYTLINEFKEIIKDEGSSQ